MFNRVSNMDKSLDFYGLLGYNEVLNDQTSIFSDWAQIEGGESEYRRVLISQKNPSGGGFSKLAGKSYIELVQDTSNRVPKKIYEDRMWGDTGFVHLGFDIRNMKALGKKLASEGFGFTCDTNDVLSMGGEYKSSLYLLRRS